MEHGSTDDLWLVFTGDLSFSPWEIDGGCHHTVDGRDLSPVENGGKHPMICRVLSIR